MITKYNKCIKGGVEPDKTAHDSVLEFNKIEESWVQVGTLKKARNYHAVSVVSKLDINDYCNY